MTNTINKILGKNILVFDLETTGLPLRDGSEYYPYTYNKKYDSSRMVSLAFSFITEFDPNNIDFENINHYIIKPIDFVINDPTFHKITQEKANEKGIKLKHILTKHNLEEYIMKADYILTHNIEFFLSILLNEIYRINFINVLEKIDDMVENEKCLCLGHYGKKKCEIPSKYNNYKIPTLLELYKFYYHNDLEKNYNASEDVNTILKILSKICCQYQEISNEPSQEYIYYMKLKYYTNLLLNDNYSKYNKEEIENKIILLQQKFNLIN